MIVFLIDADNLSSPVWVDEACNRLAAKEGGISVRRAYGSAENLRGLADVMRHWAIRPFVNLSLSKNSTDMALAVDAMELSCQVPRPTTVVIGSGDADFVPLVVRLRERGIRMVCISERGKMAQDAFPAYDEVVFVGQEQALHQVPFSAEDVHAVLVSTKAPVARKAAVKKVPTKKVAAKKLPAKKAAVKKALAIPEVDKQDAVRKADVSQILHAAPALKTGEPQRLGDVVKLLHDAKLLGKNAASTKLFNKFPDHFELSPVKQPNHVRYIRPLQQQ